MYAVHWMLNILYPRTGRVYASVFKLDYFGPFLGHVLVVCKFRNNSTVYVLNTYAGEKGEDDIFLYGLSSVFYNITLFVCVIHSTGCYHANHVFHSGNIENKEVLCNAFFFIGKVTAWLPSHCD